MTTVLQVSDLTKKFTMHAVGGREVESLRGVSFTVSVGEHVAIAGASGAGKSSLLRCIYRNYLPGSGRVVLTTGGGDVDLTALPDRAMARLRGHEIGYVAQFLGAPPRTGPFALVTDAVKRRGHSPAEAEELAAAALKRLGIDEAFWEIDCAVLSGGQRQRVNLAAGIASPPRLLLLDEPVSALDPANRELAMGLITELANHQVAVVGVYHDMEIIRRLSNRVLVMVDGLIAQDARPEDVFRAGHSSLTEAHQ